MADKEKTKMKDGIIKRGNSYTTVVYLGKDKDGKKHQKWITASTKHGVQVMRTEILHQLHNKVYVDAKGTLDEFMTKWLDDITTYNLSPLTIQGYLSIYHSGIKKALGNVLLKDLTPAVIQGYYTAKLKDGADPSTVRHHHMMLHRALKESVKQHLLPFNPADADLLTLPPVKTTEMHTFDEKSMALFLERAMNTPHYALFHTILHTGMRRSEVLGLKWEDIDLIGAEIAVSRSMHRLHNKEREVVFRTTKTKKSTRNIALTPESCNVLRKHLDNEMALWFRLNTKQGDSPDDIKVVPFPSSRLVFCQANGQPYYPDSISQSWYRINTEMLKAGEINNRIRLHDGRHSHASLLFKAGVPDKVIQMRLGHAKISTTLDLYVHPAEGMQRDAATAFSNLLQKVEQISKGLASESYVKSDNG